MPEKEGRWKGKGVGEGRRWRRRALEKERALERRALEGKGVGGKGVGGKGAGERGIGRRPSLYASLVCSRIY